MHFPLHQGCQIRKNKILLVLPRSFQNKPKKVIVISSMNKKPKKWPNHFISGKLFHKGQMNGNHALHLLAS